MSIYRTVKRTPFSDVYRAAEHSVPAASTQPRVVVKPAQPLDWTGRRKAKPADVMLRTTAAWVERLPPHVQPHALCKRFARIANALANLWHRPEASKAYLDDLLTVRRAGRKGFPQDVLNDLQGLKAFY